MEWIVERGIKEKIIEVSVPQKCISGPLFPALNSFWNVSNWFWLAVQTCIWGALAAYDRQARHLSSGFLNNCVTCKKLQRTTTQLKKIIKENLTNYLLNDAVFWDVTPCGSCKKRPFRGMYRLHHQGEKNQWAMTNVSSCWLLLTLFPSCLFFSPWWWRRYVLPNLASYKRHTA
jgi:hypothetical protein